MKILRCQYKYKARTYVRNSKRERLSLIYVMYIYEIRKIKQILLI